MKQMLKTVSCLCMIAAVCEQLMQGKRYFATIRLVLGIQVASVLIGEISTVWQRING